SYQTYQSIFSDSAAEVRQFTGLFVIFLVVCAIMYVLVIAFLIAGIVRRRRVGDVTGQGRRHENDLLIRTGLIGWSALVGTGLAALAIASFVTDRSMAKTAALPKLSITLTANQWWWDAEYT